MNEATAIPGQLAFDVDGLIRQAQRDRAGEWRGAPLGYTVDYYTPDELAAAMDRYVLEHGHFGCRRSGCWSIALTHKDIIVGSHHVVFLDADAPKAARVIRQTAHRAGCTTSAQTTTSSRQRTTTPCRGGVTCRSCPAHSANASAHPPNSLRERSRHGSRTTTPPNGRCPVHRSAPSEQHRWAHATSPADPRSMDTTSPLAPPTPPPKPRME